MRLHIQNLLHQKTVETNSHAEDALHDIPKIEEEAKP